MAVKIRFGWLAVGLLIVIVAGAGIVAYSVPRYRWRAQVFQLKAAGKLPDITWKELYHLHRHSDPFNLQGLVLNRNPYLAITNPFDSDEDIASGGQLFKQNCTFCHGSEGSGGRSGPALQNRQMSHGSTDWALYKTISNGIAGTGMPSSSLPENDRWKLAAYVKSLARGTGADPLSALSSRLSKIANIRYEDILAADRDGHQWLTYSGTYNAQRFSSNAQLTPKNVANLRLVWMRQYNTSETLIETSPLVVDGFMFVTLPSNRVEALDAETGALVWTYNRSLPPHVSTCCGLVNRGLAILGDTLYLGTLDGHLVALNIKTGSVKWDVEIADYREGYSITSAPLAFKNLVLTGVAGGEFGAPGFVSARDASTGKEVWRFDTIPHPGQPGAETWDPKALKTGGGPTWLTGTFDPELNVVYWPVGNPSPNYEGDSRRGDNLYTDSVVALDADHGSLRWHFQFTPHDQFDWDGTEILVLLDKTIAGKQHRYLVQADRNAFYYVLDRENGTFLTARPFVRQTWAQKIDEHGRPVMNPSAIPNPAGTIVYPSVAGATNWMSPSYNPDTGLIYVPVTESGGQFSTETPNYRKGEFFLGGASQVFGGPPQNAAVKALDATTGELKWEYRHHSWNAGGLLSTKGGLVFGGLGQLFLALDASSGRELWKVDTGAVIKAAPVTYTLNGRQFVTVAAGQDILTFAE